MTRNGCPPLALSHEQFVTLVAAQLLGARIASPRCLPVHEQHEQAVVEQAIRLCDKVRWQLGHRPG